MIFAIYFICIPSLSSIILQSISERHLALGRDSISWSYVSLTVVSFVFRVHGTVSVYHESVDLQSHPKLLMKDMISFLWWSSVDYKESAPSRSSGSILVRVANWLKDMALFEQAWTIVCDGPLRWWWSEQLFLFTVGFFSC